MARTPACRRCHHRCKQRAQAPFQSSHQKIATWPLHAYGSKPTKGHSEPIAWLKGEIGTTAISNRTIKAFRAEFTSPDSRMVRCAATRCCPPQIASKALPNRLLSASNPPARVMASSHSLRSLCRLPLAPNKNPIASGHCRKPIWVDSACRSCDSSTATFSDRLKRRAGAWCFLQVCSRLLSSTKDPHRRRVRSRPIDSSLFRLSTAGIQPCLMSYQTSGRSVTESTSMSWLESAPRSQTSRLARRRTAASVAHRAGFPHILHTGGRRPGMIKPSAPPETQSTPPRTLVCQWLVKVHPRHTSPGGVPRENLPDQVVIGHPDAKVGRLSPARTLRQSSWPPPRQPKSARPTSNWIPVTSLSSALSRSPNHIGCSEV